MFGKFNCMTWASSLCAGAFLAMTPGLLFGQASTATIVCFAYRQVNQPSSTGKSVSSQNPA